MTMSEEFAGEEPSLDSLRGLIQAVKAAPCGTGAVSEAIKAATFEISDRDVTRLIMACRNLKQWRKAIEVLDAARQGNGLVGTVQPNFFTYSAAISVCCKCRRLMEAMELLEEMKEAGRIDPNFYPDSVVYRLLISCSAKEGRPNKVLELHQDMIASGIEPDDQTLLLVLTALIEVREWRGAADILDRIHARQEVLPLDRYTQFIAACAKDGNLQMATEVFLTMQMVGLEPDARTCHHIMHAIEEAQHPGLGIQLVEDTMSSGITLRMETFVSLIRAVTQSGLLELLPSVANLLERQGSSGKNDLSLLDEVSE